MRAGELQDLIVFERRVISPGGLETWTLDFEDKSRADRLSETAARFIIRYRKTGDGSEINAESHRILWDGVIWHIASAVHDRRRTMLTIDCDFSMMLEATHLQSTHREYIEGLPVLAPRETEPTPLIDIDDGSDIDTLLDLDGGIDQLL